MRPASKPRPALAAAAPIALPMAPLVSTLSDLFGPAVSQVEQVLGREKHVDVLSGWRRQAGCRGGEGYKGDDGCLVPHDGEGTILTYGKGQEEATEYNNQSASEGCQRACRVVLVQFCEF
jgi:hypothetical protein